MIRYLGILVICFCSATVMSEETKVATVQIFVSTDCPIANAYSPEFNRIHAEFGPKGIDFLLVYPDPSTTEADIATHRSEYSLSPRGVRDPEHKLVKLAGATITPEVAVFDSTEQLIYRGRINNLFNDYGDKRRVITEHYLRFVLENLVEGKSLSFTETKAIGCFIEPLN